MILDLTKLKQPIEGENLLPDSSYQETYTKGISNRTTLNGEYKFLFTDKIEDEYLSEHFDIHSLASIPVPAHMELNGYGNPQYVNYMYPWDGKENLNYDEIPAHNPCGIYFKDIVLHKEEDKDYVLEFHGFEAALYLLVNGHYIGYSTKNYTRSLFDITNFVKDGVNRLTFVVFKYSFTSWLTDQDMWRFSGIQRDVNLLVLPRTYISDIDNLSLLAKDFKTGDFHFKITLNRPSTDCKIHFSFSFENKEILQDTISLTNGKAEYQKNIENINPWSDEEPNIYMLDIDLIQNNKVIESTYIKVGFRCIEIKENQIFLNGKRLVIYGVNRHEFYAKTGRVMPLDILKKDLLFMKRHNINAVRLSHYPNRVELYDICDDLGILVMDETALETHGTWIFKNNIENCLPGNDMKYKDIIVRRGLSMLERDKNHPCIISWSLGNESYSGTVLESLYKAFKERDPSRFIHYEGCSYEKDFEHISDVTSRMYPSPKKCEMIMNEHKDKPFMLCEYAHSMGNSTGNLDEYLALIDRYPSFMLGFIWDFVDQGLLVNGSYHFGGDFHDYPNDDNFCANGILTADRKENSKTKTVSYQYSKVKIHIYDNHFEIENRRSFTDTRDLTFHYVLLENEKCVIDENFDLIVNPGKTKSIPVPSYPFSKNKNYVVNVSIVQKYSLCGIEKDTVLMTETASLFKPMKKLVIQENHQKKGELKVFRGVHHLTIQKDDFRVSFHTHINGKSGLESIALGDKLFLQNLVLPTLFRPNSDNDSTIEYFLSNGYMGANTAPIAFPFFPFFKVMKETKDEVKIRFTHIFLIGNRPSFFYETYSIFSDKTIKVDYHYHKRAFITPPSIIGLRFPILKEYDHFSYTGLGKEDTYIDRYMGIPYGTYQSSAKEEYINYSIPQECGNHLYTGRVSISMHNKRLSFYALNDTFQFKYLPYHEMEIENAKRKETLPPSSMNYLTIACFSKGVGGDDSWGQRIHKQYRGKRKTYRGSFLIRIEDEKEFDF